MEARQTGFRGGPVAGTGLRAAAAVGLLAAFLTLLTASDARAQEPAADLSDLTSAAAQTVPNAGAAESPAPAPANAPVSVNPADVVPAPVPAPPDPPSASTPPVQTNVPVADRVAHSVSDLAAAKPSIGPITAAAEQTGRKADRLVSTISAAASPAIGAAIDHSLPLVGPALAPTLLAPTLQDALSAAKINEALELGTGARRRRASRLLPRCRRASRLLRPLRPRSIFRARGLATSPSLPRELAPSPYLPRALHPLSARPPSPPAIRSRARRRSLRRPRLPRRVAPHPAQAVPSSSPSLR